MKHLFVPYETALRLKEKGFDEPCIAYTFKNSDKIYLNQNTCIETGPEGETPIPLYQQVIDWFREKHNVHIIPKIAYNQNYKLQYSWYIIDEKDIEKGYKKCYEILDQAIEEALKLI